MAVLAIVAVWASLLASASTVAAQQGAGGGSGAYPDTVADSYYAEAVSQLGGRGVFVGTLCEGGFCPDEALDRKTMAVWVVRVLDEEDPAAVSGSRFSDVDAGSFYAPFVERMFVLGVTRGCGDGSVFCPDDSVTRAEMAVFLSRAFDLPGGPDPGFSDVPADAWYAAEVAGLAASGITRGCGDGSVFCPAGDTARAEMAVFLYRAVNGGSAAAPVRVPGDGSPVTVPAGSAFVAELGSVSVEGGSGVFAQATEVRVSHTTLGARLHSRFETTAAQPVLLDFGGAEPAAPLTVRFQTVRPGLEAGHVIPAVWDSELSAWVPTIDEVTVTGNEIVVRTAAGSSAAAGSSLAAAGPAGAGGVTVAAAGPAGWGGVTVAAAGPAGWGGVTVAVAGPAPPLAAALPNPCSWWVVSWGCGAVNKVVTVFVPAAWRHTEDAARALIGGAVDVARLSADAVVATAQQYLPKVMRAIEAGVAAGLEAGVAFYERWLLPALNAVFGLRAHPPVCSETTPEWAREGIDFSDTDRRDPRVHLCSEATPDGDLDGDLHVEAVNNRTFGFQVTPSDGASYENFTAPRPPDISVGSLLTNKLNGFLIDNVEALGGYQWPLSAASFDVARFEPAHRSDWTAQWLVNGDTATLDAILMGSSLMSRAADHVPFGAVALDAAECSAPIVGPVEQSAHWTAILSTAGSCLSTASTAVAKTGVGIKVAVALEAVAQAMESVTTSATTIKHRITAAEFGLELTRQPATLTITPTHDPGELPPYTVPPVEGPTSVMVAPGASAQGQPGCDTRHCRHLSITLDAPEATYDVECWSSRDDEPWGTGRWHWPSSSRWAQGGCWYGYPGEQVWVTVAGVKSNTITWPAATTPPQQAATRGEIVSAGTWHSCGVRTDDTITCWGSNQHLAWIKGPDGTRSYKWRADGKLDAPAGRFLSVSAGGTHSCGVRTDQTVVCWGDDISGQADAPAGRFTMVSAGLGSLHSCGVRTDQTVVCWGDDVFGQADAPAGRFTMVSAGHQISCGVRTDETITCWGDDVSGQADAPAGRFTMVSAGTVHACGVRTDQTIECWGQPQGGASDPPEGRFLSVSAGNSHSCGVRTDQTITCWGSGWYFDRVADKRFEGGGIDAPEGRFLSVSAGSSHSCGVRTNRTLVCWGWNQQGQIDSPAGRFGP